MKLTKLEQEKAHKLISAFTADTDRASVVIFGPTVQKARGCIVILKGGRQTRRLRQNLIDTGLLTPGKPIHAGF